MSKAELKQLIAGIDHLPTTMTVAGRALSLLFEGDPDMETAGALIGMDPALASCVLRMARVSSGSGGTETVELQEALERAGLENLRRAVLGVTLTSLSLQPHQAALERHLHHALGCATCAAKAAGRTRLVAPEEAYVAGLLHDIGRLALVAAMPDDYCAFLESNASPGIDRLERDEFDVDHALVGKWMAERWGLPRRLSQAIWFHHLPPGTLLGNRPIVNLVSVVGFANAMSSWVLGGASASSGSFQGEVQAYAARLGLKWDDVESLREQTSAAMAQRLALVEAGSNGDALRTLQKAASSVTLSGVEGPAESASLKKELKWLQALNRLNTSLRPSQSLNEVLALIVATVREGLDAAPGMCCAYDEGSRCLAGMTWDALDTPAQSFRIPLSPSSQEDLDEVEILALEALDQLGIGMGDAGWRGAERSEPELREGILMLPMVADGVTRGQIMFETNSKAIESHSRDGFKLMAFAGACGAVLARHHAYDELRELSEELAEAIARGAAERSTRKGDELAEFAIGASHALQRPLNVMANQAHLLLRRARSPEETSAAESILEQNRALSKLVGDLMAFARPGAPSTAPTVVNYVLHRLVTTLSDRLNAKGIVVVEDYEEGLSRVNVDKHQLEHALLNLIVNAEQAMADRGGELVLRTAGDPDHKSVRIVIQDTGPGIPAKHAEAIFEPFVTLRGDMSNTGLGLAVCRAVVRKHGGEVRLLHGDGPGAVFEVLLPVERERERTEPTPAPKPAIAIGRKEGAAVREGTPGTAEPVKKSAPASIPSSRETAETKRTRQRETPFEDPDAPVMPSLLLIDENETTREVLKETLRNRGFSVIAAQDAVKAMQAAAATLFDVVLLDFELKDVDGPNMLTELHNIRPGIPVIVMTADGTPAVVQSALERGARACLSKPFALHELLNEVEDAVGIHNN